MLRFNHISSLTAAIISALALFGCSSGNGDEPEMPEETVYTAGFYVTVGDEAPADSRTTPDGDYDPGAGLENYIDLTGGDVRVVLLDSDNNYLGQLSDFYITPVASYESSKRYYFNAYTTTDISSGQFKIMLLANFGNDNYPADNADFLRNLRETTYNFKGAALSKDNIIPLYGIKTVSIPGGIQPNVSVNLGTIHLIRAMAKIEVQFSDDFWTIKTLRLTHYNTSGFNTPYLNSLTEDDYIGGSYSTDYTKILNVPENTQVETGLDFIPAGEGSWVVYVPEYSNSSAGTPKAQIEIAFEESFVPHSSYVDFPTQGSGVMDIWRNYWYRFKINKKPELTDVTVEIDVTPYKVVDLEPEFGIDKHHTFD